MWIIGNAKAIYRHQREIYVYSELQIRSLRKTILIDKAHDINWKRFTFETILWLWIVYGVCLCHWPALWLLPSGDVCVTIYLCVCVELYIPSLNTPTYTHIHKQRDAHLSIIHHNKHQQNHSGRLTGFGSDRGALLLMESLSLPTITTTMQPSRLLSHGICDEFTSLILTTTISYKLYILFNTWGEPLCFLLFCSLCVRLAFLKSCQRSWINYLRVKLACLHHRIIVVIRTYTWSLNRAT